MDYYQITQKVQAELDRFYQTRLAAIHQELEAAESTEDARTYLDQLRDRSAFNSLSFCLRRFLCETLGGGVRGGEPQSFSVSRFGREYRFSPVIPGELPPEEEIEPYGDLLYNLTRTEHQCFAADRSGRVIQGKGAISKDVYMKYLRGKAAISREGIFTLSMALGFDPDTMKEFMTALGESPVYNFRDADECIYYFCHSNAAFRSMDTVRRLKAAYRARLDEASRPLDVTGLQNTVLIRRGQEAIISDSTATDAQKEEAFLQYLLEQSGQFTGFSKTAAELLQEELSAPRLLEFDYGVVEDEACFDMTFSRYHSEERVSQDCEYVEIEDNWLSTLNAIGTEIYEATVESEILECGDRSIQRRKLDLDPRVKEGLLDRKRLTDLLSPETGKRPRPTATKKDFLHLRFFKATQTLDFSALTEEERLDVLHEFRDSTNRLLLRAGLPMIYPPNPFDHMVLVSLCYEDPLAFFSRVFLEAQNDAEEGIS